MTSVQFELPELRRPAERARARRITPTRADAPVSIGIATGEMLPIPIVAQRRAADSVRGHLARDIARTATLMAGDLALVVLLQLTLHAIRNGVVVGSAAAEFMRVLLPAGTLLPRQLVIAIACGFAVTGVYLQRERSQINQRLVLGTGIAFALIFWDQAWRDFDVWRLAAILCAFGLASGALILERRGVGHLLALMPSLNPRRPRALVIGTPEDASTLQFRGTTSELDLVGYTRVSGRDDPESIGVGSDLTRMIAANRIDAVVICGDRGMGPSATQLVRTAEEAGCQVLFMPSPMLADFRPGITRRGRMPMVELTRPTSRGVQLAVKRAVDVVLSSACMIAAAPIGMVVALAVRLSSPGPILFRQMRVGVGGRRFTIYKFRSMVQDAEGRRDELMSRSIYPDARLFKVADDPRSTPVGRFLRRTSLDELPQLWNVLRGDMSLVGPRPPLPSEVALYSEHYYARFYMKPGITGPWQVSGRNRITDFREIIDLETAYMRQWHLMRDVLILFRTIPAVVRAVGAV